MVPPTKVWISSHYIPLPSFTIFQLHACDDEADSDPQFELGDKFKGLADMDGRRKAEVTKAADLGPNAENKYG